MLLLSSHTWFLTQTWLESLWNFCRNFNYAVCHLYFVTVNCHLISYAEDLVPLTQCGVLLHQPVSTSTLALKYSLGPCSDPDLKSINEQLNACTVCPKPANIIKSTLLSCMVNHPSTEWSPNISSMDQNWKWNVLQMNELQMNSPQCNRQVYDLAYSKFTAHVQWDSQCLGSEGPAIKDRFRAVLSCWHAILFS